MVELMLIEFFAPAALRDVSVLKIENGKNVLTVITDATRSF